MKLIKEFKEFISKGNVLDMAVGVIVATAFGAITTSLINDVFMPFLGWIIGDIDLSKFNVMISPAVLDEAGTVVKEAVYLGIGSFLNAVVNFLLVSLVVFIVIKVFNNAKKKLEKKKEEAPAEEPKPDPQLELLTEIRDLLKK